MIRNFIEGYTHGGVMHADEVFASALLRMIDPSFKIIRQKDRLDEIPTNDDILVFDIGRGKYDHHQEDSKLRPSGKKYSSVGLILSEFYQEIGLSYEEFLYLDKEIIEKIDLSDNYGNLCDYSSMISNFNIPWYIAKDLSSEENLQYQDESFEDAITFAKEIIKNELVFYRKGRHSNNIKDIEKLYSKAFIEISGSAKLKQDDYLSFQKICEKYYKNIFPKKVYGYFEDFVIRLQNLFVRRNLRAGYIKVINCFNLKDNEEYKKALNLAIEFLNREILKATKEVEASFIIRDYYRNSKSNFIILEIRNIPWIRETTKINEKNDRKIDFVIYLNDNGTCGIQCVPQSFYLKNTQRIPFDEAIRGMDELVLNYYLEGLTFCHSTGFYAVTKDLETAKKLIEKTTKTNKKI